MGERSLHTREVAGSKPAAPIVKSPAIGGVFGFFRSLFRRPESVGLGTGARALLDRRRRDARLHTPHGKCNRRDETSDVPSARLAPDSGANGAFGRDIAWTKVSARSERHA